jgi:hypothetical protein
MASPNPAFQDNCSLKFERSEKINNAIMEKEIARTFGKIF